MECWMPLADYIVYLLANVGLTGEQLEAAQERAEHTQFAIRTRHRRAGDVQGHRGALALVRPVGR
jgi:hypothetical protein